MQTDIYEKTFLKNDGEIDLYKFHKAYYSLMYRYTRAKEVMRSINAKDDLYDFAQLIGMRDLYEPLHRPFAEFLMDSTKKRKMWLMPRKHFKSSVGTIAYVLWRIVNNPKIKILIYSATKTLAKGFLQGIKNTIESNEAFIKRFGDMKGDKVWTKDSLLVKQAESSMIDNTFTVETAGAEDAPTSKHYDLIIFDDVVGMANYRKKEARMKIRGGFDEAVENLLRDNGEVVIFGTRWHFADLYSYILDNESIEKGGEFHCVVRHVLENFKGKEFGENIWTGDLIFPTNGKDIAYYKRMAVNKPELFWMQYMNYPKIVKGKPLNPEWVQFYDDSDPDETIKWNQCKEKGMITDIAAKKNSWNDKSAFVTFGRFGRHVVIHDLFTAKLDSDEIIDYSLRALSKNPDLFDWRIEDAGQQIHFITYARKMLNEKRHAMRLSNALDIDAVKPGNRDKEERIKQLAPYIKDGTFVFPETCKFVVDDEELDAMEELFSQMDEFPLGDYVDLLDALAYILDFYGLYDDNYEDIILDKNDRKLYIKSNERSFVEGETLEDDDERQEELIYDNDLGEVIS